MFLFSNENFEELLIVWLTSWSIGHQYVADILIYSGGRRVHADTECARIEEGEDGGERRPSYPHLTMTDLRPISGSRVESRGQRFLVRYM